MYSSANYVFLHNFIHYVLLKSPFCALSSIQPYGNMHERQRKTYLNVDNRTKFLSSQTSKPFRDFLRQRREPPMGEKVNIADDCLFRKSEKRESYKFCHTFCYSLPCFYIISSFARIFRRYDLKNITSCSLLYDPTIEKCIKPSIMYSVVLW